MNTQTKPSVETPKVSEAPLTLLQRLHAVMLDVTYVQKDRQIDVKDKSTRKVVASYKVVTHDMVTAKVRPALVTHGVFYYPYKLGWAQNGSRTEVDMVIRFVSVDDKDDFIDVPTLGFGLDAGDKGPGKAMSYAVKYALLKALGLETGEDADNEASPEKSEPDGETVPPGPRGGRDKTPPADNEIKLFGYPGENGRETLRYPRNAGGLRKWVNDMETAFANDMGVWDTNGNMIEIVMKGIDKIGAADLRDRMQEMDARMTVERTHA